MIDEDQFEIAADMTSCAPAFIASIFKCFVHASLKQSRFSKLETEKIMLKTLLGTAKVLLERKIGFDTLASAVATKGGILKKE